MPTPTIDKTQSVLGFLQWQSWIFQPVATNAPTGWSALNALPPGLSLNATTGRLSGAVTKPGVYGVKLRATNDDGDSAPVTFWVGIEATAPTQGTDIDLDFDVVERWVRRTAAIPPTGALPLEAGAAVARLRLNDTVIFNVRLVKNGAVVDVEPSACTLSLKADDSETVVQASDGFLHAESGDAARIRISLPLTDAKLKAAVADLEQLDEAKERVIAATLRALAEIEIEYPNPDADIGPDTLRLASGTFILEVSRNIVP